MYPKPGCGDHAAVTVYHKSQPQLITVRGYIGKYHRPPIRDRSDGINITSTGQLIRILFIPPHQGSGAGIAIKADAWVSG